MNFYLYRFHKRKTTPPISIEKTLTMKLTKVDTKFDSFWRCIKNGEIVQKNIEKLQIDAIINAKQSYNKILKIAENKLCSEIIMLVKGRLKTIKKLEKFLFDQKLLEIKKDCEKLLKRKQVHSANEELIKLKIKSSTFLKKVKPTDYKDIKLNIEEVRKKINEVLSPLLRSELNKINKEFTLAMENYNVSNDELKSYMFLSNNLLQENTGKNPKQIAKKEVLKNALSATMKYKEFLKKIKGAGFLVLKMKCKSNIAKLSQIIYGCKNNQKICIIL